MRTESPSTRVSPAHTRRQARSRSGTATRPASTTRRSAGCRCLATVAATTPTDTGQTGNGGKQPRRRSSAATPATRRPTRRPAFRYPVRPRSVQLIATSTRRWDTRCSPAPSRGGSTPPCSRPDCWTERRCSSPSTAIPSHLPPSAAARPSRRLTTRLELPDRARRAVAQLQFHQRSPLLVQVRREQDVHDI